MENETKTKLKQSAQAIAEAMAKWERVREIAKDIIAWTIRDARRFTIEIGSAVGTKVIYGHVSGTAKYATYGEELNDTPLRQVYERFFEDYNALVNMVSKLADAVLEVAEQNIEELKEQLK
jgi:hypothetical protein